ncbi:hypothetical protein ACLOJK_033699 [Asimina triloba]
MPYQLHSKPSKNTLHQSAHLKPKVLQHSSDNAVGAKLGDRMKKCEATSNSDGAKEVTDENQSTREQERKGGDLVRDGLHIGRGKTTSSLLQLYQQGEEEQEKKQPAVKLDPGTGSTLFDLNMNSGYEFIGVKGCELKLMHGQGGSYGTSEKISRPSKCTHSHLKKAKISGFIGLPNQAELAAMILDNSVRLELMEISSHWKRHEFVSHLREETLSWWTMRRPYVEKQLCKEAHHGTKLVISRCSSSLLL